MCIMFCTSHLGSTREHFIGTYHCAHLGCPGTIEAHHKYLLEDTAFNCSPCLRKDRVNVDPDIVPVEYYPPVEDIEIEYVGLAGYRQVEKREKKSQEQEKAKSPVQEQEKEMKEESIDLADWRSDQDFSDVDSVTSHWRLDPSAGADDDPEKALKSPSPLKGSATPFSPQDTPEKVTPNTHKHRELVNEQLAKLPYYRPPPPPPMHHQEPAFGITRPPTHAFPVGGAPVPLWPYRPQDLQPLQHGPQPPVHGPQLPPHGPQMPPHGPHPQHQQSMINDIPRRDYLLWHPTAGVSKHRTNQARVKGQIAHDEFIFLHKPQEGGRTEGRQFDAMIDQVRTKKARANGQITNEEFLLSRAHGGRKVTRQAVESQAQGARQAGP